VTVAVWFKVDDTLCSHPKATRAGNAALGAWVRLGSWSSQHLTNGHIPAGDALRYASRRELDALVSAGLLEPDGNGGFTVHDFLVYNPTRDAVLHRRAAEAERQRRMRSRRDG
jgi:hypothetical protein